MKSTHDTFLWFSRFCKDPPFVSNIKRLEMVILILFTFIATMATGDNFILNVWESQEELNYITVKSRKMARLEFLLVAVTVFLCLTSSQNLTTLHLDQSAEQETSPTVMETPLETTETSVERLDDCEEDEWSCHQKGKMEIFIANHIKAEGGKFLSLPDVILLWYYCYPYHH